MSRRGTLVAWAIATMVCFGCGVPRQGRTLRVASRDLSRAVSRSDAEAIREFVVMGARGHVDVDSMLTGTARRSWVKALDEPLEVIPEAVVFLGPDHPVRVVWTADGWRFGEDPTDGYAQRTPRQALGALVRATRAERWDVLLRLAPRRYRLGLSEEDLRRAWTEGEQGEALRAARDRLASHLADPILADADEAALDMGQGHVARLEREGDHWVVVEF
ncbi:hypothetical protein [Paraliomyxa miuraensis]|uniref:hypothetical protein n=1 Tax=Paraliomyxa miuraensis TaxID=376150 RepID=UPI002257F6ED|nr:hypothetical protein [Paraliomyxa miuraensis]MCX4244609.1 hypothetical protein [Paraliomyxa miuraensis]